MPSRRPPSVPVTSELRVIQRVASVPPASLLVQIQPSSSKPVSSGQLLGSEVTQGAEMEHNS
jgi:hypothetical protein